MAAAGVGGDKDEHMAERFLLMAANSGNAAAPAVWYRLAQIRKSTPYSGFEWNIC
jgi:TPR repeat protein